MENKNDKQIKIVCDSNAPGSDFRIIDGELQQYIGIDRIVYVPEGVTRIGSHAFSDNKQMEEVNIPDGVTEIGDFAFFGCINLKRVELPETTISRIGDNAFSECHSLCEINVPEGTQTEHTTFSDCYDLADSDGFLIVNHILYGYYGKETIEELTVPEGVTAINDSVFEDFTQLTKVNLPDSLKYIGELAFSGCYALEDINLEEINVPEKAKIKIGMGAFSLCAGLCNSDGLIIVNDIFYGGGYKTSPVLKIPQGVKKIDDYADFCPDIEEAELPEGLKYIGKEAFADCRLLRTVNIPNSVNIIAARAFQNCVSLTDVNIPDDCAVHPTAFTNDHIIGIEKLRGEII